MSSEVEKAFSLVYGVRTPAVTQLASVIDTCRQRRRGNPAPALPAATTA